MGQPIKLCTVANFINIHRTIFNWYYVTKVDNAIEIPTALQDMMNLNLKELNYYIPV